jgi:SAM-dependent methyltransferase
MKEYWDNRFGKEGRIWGDAPSKTAEYALGLFRANGVKKLLIPGAGYGRNSKLFSAAGLEVVGIELSLQAFKLGRAFDSKTKFLRGSVLDIPLEKEAYDGIYCLNVLHLFREDDRRLLIDRCGDVLKNKGIAFFTVFSEKEKSFGKGLEVEKNTFESKPGRPVHYFTEADLKAHFEKFMIIENGLMEDAENHGEEGPHTHLLRYIVCEK